ncbi:hypothetical protein AB1Y20_018275 [Prymnesium parvum]|uniref:AB hydrolase-1 domain-containing protein n=1 Tax=Prymnesium parvum TaxID=97485 RepID=A0AB34JRS7_PRYPA
MPVYTNDGVPLHYVEKGTGTQPLVLIHGWSGSHRYFDSVIDLLAPHFRVYAYDLRFHGESGKPTWGFHVARLAADLHDFLREVGLTSPILLGTSLGCAVIWAYVELYGDAHLKNLVFVDQAPSQWKMADWSYCSKGIYDAQSLANIQAAVMDMDAFADGNAACCLSRAIPAELSTILKSETLKCEPLHLAKLMADHAQLDWRPLLPRISIPCLNLYGSESGCFPVEGCQAVGELIPNCKNVLFEGCNHWLYLEEPGRFAREIVDFCH